MSRCIDITGHEYGAWRVLGKTNDGIPREELRPELFKGVTVVRPEGKVVR